MAPHGSAHRVKKTKAKWSMTVMMNARDLSRDDDFLSHLLVEHLGTDENPLQVHKMDPSRRLPKHEPSEVLAIVKKYVVRRGGSSTSAHRVKRAVDALLELTAVKQYLHKRSTAQINAFATHASRYFELYLPTGSIEISHTSRYSHRTGKSELCILATTALKVGQVISDLKGSLAHLTVEEDEELKKTDSRRRDGGIRRDFSVIHSNQKNKSHLFLGPARFVNHDCDHNVELFRDGRIITFRVIKPIAAGQEVTAHYGEGYCRQLLFNCISYRKTSLKGCSLCSRAGMPPELLGACHFFEALFRSLMYNVRRHTDCKLELVGKGNRHCLCETCERLGRGGYTPEEADSDHEVGDDSSTDEETREARIKAGLGLNAKGNPNERRTRRGVYAILPEEDTDDEDRVGTSEKVAVELPQKSIPVNGLSGKHNGVVCADFASPSSSASPPTSSAATPTATEGMNVKQHERHMSSASSTLSSLPDSDKAIPDNTRPSSVISDPLAPLPLPGANMPLTDSLDTVPHDHGKSEIVRAPVTPATSRMSTRSSTASQRKANPQDENSPDVDTRANQANSIPAVARRSLRGSRSMASLTGLAKEQRQSSSQATKASSMRQARHSMSSAPGIIKESELSVSDVKVPSSGSVAKSAGKPSNLTKSPADVSNGLLPGTKVEGKSRPNVPRCGTCTAEIPRLIGIKSPKKALSQCARCKRHYAIFGAFWPNRNASTESLSSSSSESSSTESALDVVHEEPRDYPRPGYKIKYSRKDIEIKHPTVERPVKRRKTDSSIFSTKIKSILHPSRNSHARFDGKGIMTKRGVFPQKTFGIGNGRSQRTLGKDKLRNLGFTATSLGMKRRWADGAEDPEQHISDKIRSRRRGWEEGGKPSSKFNPFLFVSGPRRTIRRFPSVPSLSAAKPLAALCARPTPNSFARHSWTFSEHDNVDAAVEQVDTGSELTELPDSEAKSVPDIGQKRKRDPMPSNSKPKGRRFYMKDEKKPMPKGWVLVTDSSEDTGEEGDEAGPRQDSAASGEPSGDVTTQLQVGAAAGSDSTMRDRDCHLEAGGESPPASTPSLTYTPFSRATSTPTQSSGTLVDEHAGVPPSGTKRTVSRYLLRGSTTIPTAPVALPSKRRKVASDGSYSQNQSPGNTNNLAGANSTLSSLTEAGDSDSKLHVPTQQVSTSPELDIYSEDVEPFLEDAKPDIPGQITMMHASFPPSSGSTAKGGQVSTPAAASDNSPAIFIGNYQTPVLGIDVPDSESKRIALEVSNLIHGTAFSFGLPDARTTWKPKYHFSELDGWDSDHSEA